jgi:hypothetical protein
MSILTANMNLPVSTIGVDSGLNWETNLNASLSILDGHNHAPGSGQQINPAGLNINSDLPINSNNLTLLRSVRFSPQVTPISGASDIGCLYESGADLYYNDASGNQIRITQSGSVTGATGTITGLPSGSASASYGAGSFVFQSATSTAATLDGASIILRLGTANSNGLTLSPPSGLSGGSYTLTLPTVPAQLSAVTIDASGNISSAPQSDYFNPTGAMMDFGGASAPTGWLICNGSAISRVTYSALFAVIGTNYGVGDGSTTFNLPPCGVFYRSVSGTSGNDPNASSRSAINGGNSGNNVGSFQTNATAVNGLHDYGHVHPNNWTDTGLQAFYGGAGTPHGLQITGTTTTGTGYASLGGDAETRPVNVYITKIIKT